MSFRWVKYSACGNEFIVINTLFCKVKNPRSLARQLCAGHGGLFADGLLLLGKTVQGLWTLRIFNADGSSAEMCGNGLRCLAKYVADYAGPGGSTPAVQTFLTPAGYRTTTIVSNRLGKATIVRAGLGKAENIETRAIGWGVSFPRKWEARRSYTCPRIGLDRLKELDSRLRGNDTVRVGFSRPDLPPCRRGQVHDTKVGQREDLIRKSKGEISIRGYSLSFGNPHFVVPVESLEAVPLLEWGPYLEHHSAFPQGTNVSFYQRLSKRRLKALFWERGVGETLSCGTSTAAVATVEAFRKGLPPDGRRLTADCRLIATVEARGGALKVRLDSNGGVSIEGPVLELASGLWCAG